ncbi:hypothetical protein KAR91_03530 [Candidatus Pacearchaeota archaeon]|nr:hypothetical protein [Candidatus Pacearchaeota archaeon]
MSMELYCPTCEVVLTGFNDLILPKEDEHHGIHRECGFIVQKRVVGFKNVLK